MTTRTVRRRSRSIESPRLAADRSGGVPAPTPKVLRQLYTRLKRHYGPQSWWPAGTELEMVLGALLVQNTSWSGARRALDSLIAADKLDPHALLATPEAEVAELIRASGYFNSKARKLKAFVQMLADEANGDLETLLAKPFDELRPLLLATHGFGRETADAVCLYAARRKTFVVDAYTRRVLNRLGLAAEKPNYEWLRAAFVDAVPARNADPVAYCAEFHALFVAHAKQTCRKRPLCDACPLLEQCPAGQAEAGLRHMTSIPAPVGAAPADWND